METRCYGCMQLKTSSPVCEHCGYDARSANALHQLPAGTVVGDQYILGRVLGQGGFGITYLGWDRAMNRPVAVKEYFPSGYAGRDTTVQLQVRSYDTQKNHIFETNKTRFLREAESLAKLWDIPQIVRILRCFEENNTAYIAMEYVEGVDLKKYLRQKGRRLTARETFELLYPVMEALRHVHRANLVHRDISPDNIMILPDGSAKLLDFGAARYVENPDAEGVLNTSTQAILKHGFAPPEQYQSRGSLGPWTDVYAMCATAYYCLSGKVPVESMSRMMEDAELDWSCVSPLTGKERAALEKGLALKPKDRFHSMEELCGALMPPPEKKKPDRKPPEQPKEKTVSPKPKNPAPSGKGKKGKGLVGLAAAAILAAAVGIGTFAMGGRGPAPEQEAVSTAPREDTAQVYVQPTEAQPAEVQTRVYKVGVVMYQYNDNFIANYRQALEQYFATLETDAVKYELTMFDSRNDMALQTSQVEELIVRGVDAIILNPVQPSASDALIEEVASAGIPLILINREPMGQTRESYPGIVNNPKVCYVGTDPRQAGYTQGRILLDQPRHGDINGDGVVKYVMIIGDPENLDAQWRTEYAIQALTEAGVAVECLVENVGNWDPVKGQEIAAAALAYYGNDVEVIFCNNDGMALGAVAAIESTGRTVGQDIYLLGIDAIPECMEMVRTGRMTGTVKNDYALQARTAADVAVAAMNGEEIRNYYWVDYVTVDKAYMETQG